MSNFSQLATLSVMATALVSAENAEGQEATTGTVSSSVAAPISNIQDDVAAGTSPVLELCLGPVASSTISEKLPGGNMEKSLEVRLKEAELSIKVRCEYTAGRVASAGIVKTNKYGGTREFLDYTSIRPPYNESDGQFDVYTGRFVSRRAEYLLPKERKERQQEFENAAKLVLKIRGKANKGESK